MLNFFNSVKSACRSVLHFYHLFDLVDVVELLPFVLHHRSHRPVNSSCWSLLTLKHGIVSAHGVLLSEGLWPITVHHFLVLFAGSGVEGRAARPCEGFLPANLTGDAHEVSDAGLGEGIVLFFTLSSVLH